MSLLPTSIRDSARYGARLTIHYATVYVDTNLPGFDSAVRNAVREMDTKSSSWADDARMAMDRGYRWGYTWTDEQWNVRIQRADIYAGVYLIRIETDFPHYWLPLARYLKNLINKRGLYLGNTYRRQYVLRIMPGPPTVWPTASIAHFQFGNVKRYPRHRRRGVN